jgi:hypothetical protein
MAEQRPGSPWTVLALALGLAAAVLGYLKFVVGVELDAATLGLALACAALIGALRGMWGVVFVLARPGGETSVEVASVYGSKAELREEKQRVLRAIKELEFDHDMGKLSDADFKLVSDAYRLRAIEVMRALDEGGEHDLHPLLREHLAALSLATPASEGSTSEGSTTETTTAAGESPAEASA